MFSNEKRSTLSIRWPSPVSQLSDEVGQRCLRDLGRGVTTVWLNKTRAACSPYCTWGTLGSSFVTRLICAVAMVTGRRCSPQKITGQNVRMQYKHLWVNTTASCAQQEQDWLSVKSPYYSVHMTITLYSNTLWGKVNAVWQGDILKWAPKKLCFRSRKG